MSEDLKGLNNTDPNPPAGEAGYWQSFEELHNDPEFLKIHQDEFKEDVTDSIDTSEMSSISHGMTSVGPAVPSGFTTTL